MYNVVSKTYEGPFDILLDFAKDDEIDVAGIAVLDIVENSVIRNVDEGSEFIVDAANLLYMKSVALLPKEEEKVETQEEVDAQKLLELYNKMKEVAGDLERKELRQKDVFYRDADRRTDFAEEEFKEATLYDLLLAFKSVLAYLPKEEILNISREGITVRQKINELIDYLEVNTQIAFIQFLKDQKTREHIITAFLAILEMIKLGLILCRHNVANNDIFITRKA
ncbi:MAG: segregation/condensation protein A [Candidatus Firestonebacteria bacterium]